MNLSRKTFLYSVIISGSIATFLIAYFILMLPSLYVAHMRQANLESIKTIQRIFIADGSYKNVSSVNPVGTATVKIPATGNVIFLSNKLCSINITIEDKDILNIIDKIRYYSANYENMEDKDMQDFEFSGIENIFEKKVFRDDLPLSFEFIQNDFTNMYEETSSKFHMVDSNTFVFEFNGTDGSNHYTSYIAFSHNKGDAIITLLTTITPQIKEIRPIIFQSLPMIIACALLLVLISTMLFSRKIVLPVEKLANHAVFMKENTNREVEPVIIEGHDEIAFLAETLNELYFKLYKNFNELEQKNKYLSEQNKRQEVFLRSSSHQLKTPVSAALLLVEGMMNEVGKYKNTKEYLPEVKLQLQSMRKIVYDIINLNNSIDEIGKEAIKIGDIVEESLANHEVQLKLKELTVEKELDFVEISTDRKLLYKIVDNLISNAANYTPNQQRIKIKLTDNSLTITNYGALVDEELLPHIFDPFVSSNNEVKGHGLGLYIVAYYANLLNFKAEVRNTDDGVESILYFNV